jgi:hypothetical protein
MSTNAKWTLLLLWRDLHGLVPDTGVLHEHTPRAACKGKQQAYMWNILGWKSHGKRQPYKFQMGGKYYKGEMVQY